MKVKANRHPLFSVVGRSYWTRGGSPSSTSNLLAWLAKRKHQGTPGRRWLLEGRLVCADRRWGVCMVCNPLLCCPLSPHLYPSSSLESLASITGHCRLASGTLRPHGLEGTKNGPVLALCRRSPVKFAEWPAQGTQTCSAQQRLFSQATQLPQHTVGTALQTNQYSRTPKSASAPSSSQLPRFWSRS